NTNRRSTRACSSAKTCCSCRTSEVPRGRRAPRWRSLPYATRWPSSPETSRLHPSPRARVMRERKTARAPVSLVMRRLAKAIYGLDEPPVGKIAKDQQEEPFRVVVATLLSAQTRDAVTHAASTRLFRVARTPRSMARLDVARIQALIYPVSFYRHKAVHVKQTSERIMTRFGGRVPSTMDELLTLPGV